MQNLCCVKPSGGQLPHKNVCLASCIWSIVTSGLLMSRIRGVVANYLASQVRDPGIDSHQHLKDSWHIWRHLRRDTVFSCNLRFRLIFLHGCSRTHCVASLRAVPVGRISYNLYFDCKQVACSPQLYCFKQPTLSVHPSHNGLTVSWPATQLNLFCWRHFI